MTVDELVKWIEDNATVAGLLKGGPDVIIQNIRPVMDHFDPADQVVAHAVDLGVIYATIDDIPTDYEQTNGVLLTFEDRLKLLMAMVRAAYKDAMEAHKHPDFPKLDGGMVN